MKSAILTDYQAFETFGRQSVNTDLTKVTVPLDCTTGGAMGMLLVDLATSLEDL